MGKSKSKIFKSEVGRDYDYAIVSGGFDPIHPGHIEMFREAKNFAYNIVVLANSDAWLVKKKGRSFMTEEHRVIVLESIVHIDEVYLQTADYKDMSSSVAIKDLVDKIRSENSEATICFCNGGDRKDEESIREASVCNELGVDLVFGVGGDEKQASSSDLLEAYSTTVVERPWGMYRVLGSTPDYVIKELILEPGKSISLQYHKHRAEHWVVLSGVGEVQINNEHTVISKNKVVHVEPLQIHQVTNTGHIPLRIVEVWTGEFLAEDDIVRLDSVG